MIKSTMYENGAIRNPAGKLIGFYESANKLLHVDGYVIPFMGIQNAEEAHEMFAAMYEEEA